MVSCEVYSHDFGLTLFFFFVINLSWEHLQLQSEHGGYTGTALYVKSCLNAILVVKLLHWWGGKLAYSPILNFLLMKLYI